MPSKLNASLVIFDLDGTLYNSKMIDVMNIEAAIDAISRFRNISTLDATSCFWSNRLISSNGQEMPVSVTLKNLGVPSEFIESSQSRMIDAGKFLTADVELSELMTALASIKKIALFTNTNKDHAVKILEYLGISHSLFSIIRAGKDLVNPKPSAEELLRLIRDAGALPEESIVIGDRWDVDIAPAIQLNSMYFHVKTVSELKRIISELLNHHR